MRRFTISDIHGCALTFEALIQKINLSPKDELYVLGDYVNRGANSKKVFDIIFSLKQEGYRIHCLKGNHEQMLLDSLTDKRLFQIWVEINGGKQTLDSFGVERVDQIPTQYLDFMASLPHYLEIDGYVLVHAGFDFNEANPLENQEAMLWKRDWYGKINSDWLDNRIIVHGHTPQSVSALKFQLFNIQRTPAIDIDCGCVYAKIGMNQLCAFELNERSLTFQPNIDGTDYSN